MGSFAPAQPVRVAWEGEALNRPGTGGRPNRGSARYAVAHDSRGDGLEPRRADGPHRPRP